jgi:hypothetical protein
VLTASNGGDGWKNVNMDLYHTDAADYSL